MTQQESIQLIQQGILAKTPEIWADFGCGTGAFTTALATLLPAGSKVVGVDKSYQKFPKLVSEVQIEFLQNDFLKDELSLPHLDGILMANSLHFVADKVNFLKELKSKMENPKFLIVEYDTNRANHWVPYPINFKSLQILFLNLGYSSVQKLKEQQSIYGGEMYAALIKN